MANTVGTIHELPLQWKINHLMLVSIRWFMKTN